MIARIPGKASSTRNGWLFAHRFLLLRLLISIDAVAIHAFGVQALGIHALAIGSLRLQQVLAACRGWRQRRR